MRWPIIQTLLWKEALRFRYNWGLLIMIGGVLALAALVSLGEKLGEMPGQPVQSIKVCILRFEERNPIAKKWGETLLQREPEGLPRPNQTVIARQGDSRLNQLRGIRPEEYLFIDLIAPSAGDSAAQWRVIYRCYRQAFGELITYRLWVQQVAHEVMGGPTLVEQVPTFSGSEANAGEEQQLPKIMTALVIFAFYLLSFNLFITSTAEEREKKALLAIMLSPARPVEVIGAKVIFYSISSLAVSSAVVALLDYQLLVQPLLWSTILAGSVSYVCIGTVVLCLVRRQSTINTVSMVYLLAAALVMSLSVFLIPFAVLRFVMVENYLFHQLEMILGRRANPLARVYQPALWALTAGWFLIAVLCFSKKGIALESVKRKMKAPSA